jgi:large subunit ribosomal protein L24
MKKIRKGDQVIVIAGKDKGKKGTVLAVLSTGKILVEGINTVKKHVKANPNTNERCGILNKTLPIDISNAMLFDTTSEKGGKVGIKILDNGKKVRYFKSTNEVIDV